MAPSRRSWLSLAVLACFLAAGLVWWAQRSTRSPPGQPQAAGEAPGGPRPPRMSGQPAHHRCGVTGAVRTPDGRALPGAFVAATDSRLAVRAVAAADSAGRFCLELVPGPHRVSAQAAGFLPAVERVKVPPEGAVEVDLVLAAGGQTVRGRVLDASGGPIGGARVQVALDTFRNDGPANGTVVAVTTPDGGYRITVPRGAHTFLVAADGYAPLRRMVEVLGDETRNFRLLPASRLSGKVVARGVAVAGAMVRITGGTGWTGDSGATTDEQGLFSFGSLEPGVYGVVARHGALAGRVAVPVTLTLAAHVEGIVIELQPGRRIAGQVRGPDGPLSGAQVRLAALGPGAGGETEVRTGADGSFRFEGLLRGSFAITATADRLVPVNRRIVVGDQDVTGVELILERGAELEGLVLDRAGRPAPGAEVDVEIELDGRALAGSRNKGGGSSSARSDGQGRFRVETIPAGSITIEAQHPDHGMGVAGPMPLAAGERRQVIVRLTGGHHVSGRVRWRDGAPAAGVSVSANGAGEGIGRALTDDQGRYRVGPFPRGAMVIVDARQESDGDELEQPPMRGLKMGDKDIEGVDFTLTRADGIIRGVVVGPAGEPLGGASVQTVPGGRDGRVVTADDGTFSFERLARRSYTLIAEYPGEPPARVRNVSPGPALIRVRIEAGGSVAGVVVRASGAAVTTYVLTVARALGGSGGAGVSASGGDRVRSDSDRVVPVSAADGAFELTRLESGTYDLAAVASDGKSGHLTGIAVAPGASRRGLRLLVGDGVRLSGWLVDWETGTPLAGARARADSSGHELTASSGPDGRFQLDDLPVGIPVAVSFEAAGYQPPNRLVTIAPGETARDLGNVPLVKSSRLALGRDTKGKVGLIVTVDDDGNAIVRNAPEGLPAATAGVRQGDVVTRIDGRDARNLGIEPLVGLLRGHRGTSVTIEVQRAGVKRSFTITRA